MAEKIISKRTDPDVRRLKEIRDGENRTFLFAEGKNLLEELLKSHIPIETIYFLKNNREEVGRLLHTRKPDKMPRVILMESHVMEFVSDVKTPPGIISVAKRPLQTESSPTEGPPPFILVLDGLQLPQNVGALIRTAEAGGITEVWITSHSADPFSPKSLRASAGSAFRQKIKTNLSFFEAVKILKDRGIQTFGAAAGGDRDYDEVDWTKGSAIVVGQEGRGFSEEEMKAIKNTVKIPMLGSVESLNVGIAAAICIFEGSKQRRKKINIDGDGEGVR